MEFQGLLSMHVSLAQPVIVVSYVYVKTLLSIICARLATIRGFDALCSAGIVGCHGDIDVGG